MEDVSYRNSFVSRAPIIKLKPVHTLAPMSTWTSRHFQMQLASVTQPAPGAMKGITEGGRAAVFWVWGSDGPELAFCFSHKLRIKDHSKWLDFPTEEPANGTGQRGVQGLSQKKRESRQEGYLALASHLYRMSSLNSKFICK